MRCNGANVDAVCFNTQPPEGGWAVVLATRDFVTKVSTHSRLKAAGSPAPVGKGRFYVSTHSRLKAAGCLYRTEYQGSKGFNTQPPEGGWLIF